MEPHEARVRSRWRTAVAAVGAVAIVVLAAFASPAPADTPYVVVAWAAVAVGAGILVVELGRDERRPSSVGDRRLEAGGWQDRVEHEPDPVVGQVDGVVGDAGGVRDASPVGEHRVRVA